MQSELDILRTENLALNATIAKKDTKIEKLQEQLRLQLVEVLIGDQLFDLLRCEVIQTRLDGRICDF